MHRPLASRSWRLILPVMVAVLLHAAPAVRGGLVISLQDVSAPAGTTGNTVEVDLQNTGAAVAIASFSFEISVASGSGVTFTGADINTTIDPYIFAGNSAQGPSIVNPPPSPPPGATLDASDNAATGSTTLGTGVTVALGRVSFDVAGTAPPGPVTVSFGPYSATSFTGPPPDFANIPFDTPSNGTITIRPSGLVPEPSALVSAALGLLGAALLIRGRRSRSGPRTPSGCSPLV